MIKPSPEKATWKQRLRLSIINNTNIVKAFTDIQLNT